MSDESFVVCEFCGVRVEPASADVVYAVELKPITTFGGSETIEGMGAYFHAWCFPEGSPSYTRKPKPNPAT